MSTTASRPSSHVTPRNSVVQDARSKPSDNGSAVAAHKASDPAVEPSSPRVKSATGGSGSARIRRANIPPPNKDLLDPVLDPRRMRRIKAEDPEWNVASVPSLVDLCLTSLISRFCTHPFLHKLPNELRQRAIKMLDTKLPLKITSAAVADEDYWERCYRAQWKVGNVRKTSESWKRLFFERYVQTLVEEFAGQSSQLQQLEATLGFAAPFITKLDISQLRPLDGKSQQTDFTGKKEEESGNEFRSLELCNDMSPLANHINIGILMQQLPGLESLSLCYQVKQCGMDFTWSKLGMSVLDASLLGNALLGAEKLTSLSIHDSLIDDEKLQTLVGSLSNTQVLHTLDLSSNSICDSGARSLAKLLHENTSICKLDLKNNKIGPAGARVLGLSLRQNATLLDLSLRLNKLGADGGSLLFDTMLGNETITSINVSSNGLTEDVASTLCKFIRSTPSLKNLDLSCNNLSSSAGEMIVEAVGRSTSLVALDLRLTSIDRAHEEAVNQVLAANAARK